MSIKTFVAVLGVSALICAGNAVANPIQAVTLTHALATSISEKYTLGYELSTNANISVTDLGAFDDGGDGFSNNHEVGLFDDSGNLLTSVTVTSNDALDGDFRYASIASLLLQKGNTYFIGAADFGGSGGGTITWPSRS